MLHSLLSNNTPLWAKTIVHLSFDAPLGCFHFLAINNAAVNVHLVIVWTYLFISLASHFILSDNCVDFTISQSFFFFLIDIHRNHSLGTKEPAGTISLQCPSAQAQSHLRDAVQLWHWPPNLLTPSTIPSHSSGTALLNHSCLSSTTAGLSPRKSAQAPAHTSSDQIQEGLSSSGGCDRSHFTSTQGHT